SFLKTGFALPALCGAAPSFEPSATPFDPWIEINSGALRHNGEEISRRVARRPILAVIKNNGYGMGVVNAARLLEPMPSIAGFAVVKMGEDGELWDART